MKFEWTPEIMQTAIAMRDQSKSCSEIAEAIGAPSRNAVIGKFDRLNLPRLDKQARGAARAAAKPKKARRTKGGVKPVEPVRMPVIDLPAAPPARAPLPLVTEAPPAESGRVPFMCSRDLHCRWPMWDDTSRPDVTEKFICGDPAEERSSYCRKHAALSRGNWGVAA